MKNLSIIAIASIALTIPACTFAFDAEGNPILDVDGVTLGELIEDRVNEQLAELNEDSGK